jgi:outer membrane immunogenic protein
MREGIPMKKLLGATSGLATCALFLATGAEAGTGPLEGAYAGMDIGYGQTLYQGSNRGTTASETYTQDFGSYNEPRLGGFAGYGKAFGNWFVAPEFKIQTDNDATLEVHPSVSNTFTLRQEFTYGGGLRLGYLARRDTLVYVRGDYLRSRFKLKFTGDGTNDTRTLDGWDAGIGTELAVGSGFSVRGEYLWSQFETFTRPTNSYEPSIGMARLGVAYHFGVDDTTAQNEKPVDFGGFYVGLQSGYGDASAKELMSDQRQNDTFYYSRPAQGFTGGLYAGYGWMPGRVYIGGEAEANLDGYEMKEDVADGTRNRWGMNYTYGASLRGGYRITNTAMLYGRVGAVRSGVEYQSNRGRHSEEELWGLRMGVGMEIAMTDKVMVRGEYTHTAYEKMTYLDANGQPDELAPRENLFRVGLAYKF